MSGPFDADKFVQRIRAGEFDGRLQAELRKLSDDELQAVLKALKPNDAPGLSSDSSTLRKSD